MELKCFAFGANSYGQLGDGTQEDQLLPVEVQLKGSGINVPDIKQIIGGGGHTLFLIENGECFACGSNNRGQCCLGPDYLKENIINLTPTVLPKVICKVAAGWDFSFFLTEDKKLYSCGSNAFGQLGIETIKGFTRSAQEVKGIPGNVRDVACGLRHTVVCNDSGIVYCCGSARKGQLGFVESPTSLAADDAQAKLQKQVFKFMKVSLPADVTVKTVTAGAYHTAGLTDDGQIIIWGDNRHGQCTIKCSLESVPPRVIEKTVFEGNNVVLLRSGWTHLIALTDEGKLYTWGRDDYGQLGRKTTSDHHRSEWPIAIDLANGSEIAVGSEHNLILRDGVAYTWGWNEHGMCGTGDEKNVTVPMVIPAFVQNCQIVSIGSGAGHSFVIVKKLSAYPS